MTGSMMTEETKKAPSTLGRFEVEDTKDGTGGTNEYELPDRQGCASCFFGFLGFGKKKKKQNKAPPPPFDNGELVGR